MFAADTLKSHIRALPFAPHVKRLTSRVPAQWLELRVLALIFFVAISGWVFIEIADEVAERESDKIDRAILMWLRSADVPERVLDMVRDITALGSTITLTLFVGLTAAFLLLAGRLRTGLFVIFATASGAAVAYLLKATFNRPRPDVVAHDLYIQSASFPSGHAMISAIVYLTLGALIAEIVPKRALKAYAILVAAFLAGIVGLSRVYLGVHWPTDVLAGWAAGAAWAAICWGVAHVLSFTNRDKTS